jgi:7,8-dihydropterin-6-yl-methyl-4-(beta-D-ribofuranosyl)aminobenzene 5'-phosphate synthase
MPTKITIIYDNVSFDPRLKTAWGFAALVEHWGTNLMFDTRRGTVIVNGCSHPGIVSVIELAKELLPAPVHLVMGGFHPKDHQRLEITEIAQAFKRLGVEKVAPSHCTGDKAIGYFKENYGVSFVSSGVGKIIYVE